MRLEEIVDEGTGWMCLAADREGPPRTEGRQVAVGAAIVAEIEGPGRSVEQL